MASVHDVAAYILQQQGSMSTWKLQKLVYYSQAWHLAWDEEALFPEPIEAWANGPVVRDLYNAHKGWFTVRTWSRGEPAALSTNERETVEAVLESYGHRSGHWLSELTHAEEPWREARAGLAPEERGTREITVGAMADYYGRLLTD
jgi:uncharacterized phage-associated protein